MTIDFEEEDNIFEGEEENREEEILSDEKEDIDGTDENKEVIELLLICDECDNRWEDISIDDEGIGIFCPYCGSDKVTQM